MELLKEQNKIEFNRQKNRTTKDSPTWQDLIEAVTHRV